MRQELVFHESFDSVRARSLDPDVNPELAQVQTESLLTLLLGRSITINNGHAFDSRSVLYLLGLVFDSAAAVASRENVTELQLYRRHPPVIVRRHNTPTLLSGCMDQLNRLAPENRFILSAWRHIDDDDDARVNLARILQRIQDGAALASIALPDFVRADQLAYQQLATLERLHHYLREVPGVNLETEPTKWGVPDRIRFIQDNGITGLIDIANQVNCPEDQAEAIYRAIHNRRPELVNRTWVYGNEFLGQVGDAAPLVRELVNTLHNAQLARSAAATTSCLSTPPRSRNVLAEAQVNELALAVATIDPDLPPGQLQLDEAAPMSGVFEMVGMERNLNVRPLSTIFQAYWSLIADDEQRQLWQKSSDDVNRLLRQRTDGPGARFEFAEAWDNHLALLHDRFSDALTVNGDTLQLAGEHDGERYAQSNEPGRLRWASLDQAVAAGEYLDMLSQAAQ